VVAAVAMPVVDRRVEVPAVVQLRVALVWAGARAAGGDSSGGADPSVGPGGGGTSGA
jgi:hypothetical protein